MKIVDLTNNNEVIVKVDTEIGYKLALNPQIKGMFVYEDGNTYVALFNDGDTNWIEDAKTLDLACQWLTGKIDSTELYEKNEELQNCIVHTKNRTDTKGMIEKCLLEKVEEFCKEYEIEIKIDSLEVFGSRLEGDFVWCDALEVKIKYTGDINKWELMCWLDEYEIEYDETVVEFTVIKNEEVIEMKREKDIEIFSIEETEYEDGSYWVEYKIKGTKKTSIEIVNGDEEDAEEDIEKKFFEKGAEKLCNKINLEECSEKMQEVIHDCLMSENGTWFIDESDDMEKELEQLIAEIEELGLCDCMVVDDEEGIEITIYGETITKFIY